MSPVSVRILTAPDAASVARELRRVGCHEGGVALMAPKGLLRLVRIEGVAAKAANILKQEMLAVGGDAAVHWQTVACAIATTDVVLLGTEKHLGRLCEKLRHDPFGLPALADDIRAALAAYDVPGGELRCGAYRLPLGAKTYVMGIVNLTPDSFSGDGLAGSADAARRQAEAMLADGADILDVGGESTRPGAAEVSLDDELARILPAVRALADLGAPISVDTTKAEVARRALDAGATMVNDISGLRADTDMARVVAETGVPVVVMHMQGTPRTMQHAPHYDDLLTEVCAALRASTALAEAAGVPRDQVILDPGFGFGKTVEHNLELLRRLREFTSFGQPLLVGASRKATLGHVLGGLPAEERLEGTAATVALAIANGADLVRVHDVRAMARVARMSDAVVRG